MSIAERRQEEKEQRRQDIIDAAEAVFARKGVEKATMADVADEARLSRGLIYFYFKDKDALYLAIMLRATQALYDLFQQAIVPYDRGLDRIKALGRAYLEFHNKMPNYFDAMAAFESRTIELEGPSEGERDCLLEGKKIIELMKSVIEHGIEDGSIRGDSGDPLGMAICLWGFTHGIIQIAAKKETMLEYQFGIQMDALIDQAFGMMDRSIST